MAKLLLHVGAHKTGTTYLQRMFDRNRARLRAAGLVYPDIGPNDAHHALAGPWIDVDVPETFYGPEGPDGLWRRLVETYADEDCTVILSAENFSRARPRRVDMAELARKLAPFDEVRVVYTLRRQVELVPAVWTQVAKSRKAMPLKPYIDRVMEERLAYGVPLDHGRVYAHLLQGFAPEQIVLQDYAQARRAPGGILGSFLALTGSDLDPASLSPLPRSASNISPDPLAMYMAARISDQAVPPEDMVRRISGVLTADGQGPTTLMTRHEYSRIDTMFRRRNAELVERVQPWQPGFAVEEAEAPEGMIFRNDLTQDHWAAIAAEFYRDTQTWAPPRPSWRHLTPVLRRLRRRI